MKTAELTAAPLDYWVARSIGNSPVIRKVDGKAVCLVSWMPFEPSTAWSQGGPIVERHHVAIEWDNLKSCWIAKLVHIPRPGGVELFVSFGDTPLVAAMRALVQSRFGKDVYS
ncbi:phage protein NinX family protein [Variovorax rhizosphaerae]|uniref:Phage protein NinX family protein n=1 Tax=Variovorax rhizosphaerae TaxID=1836200 RepID=A0ABU8WXG8_9BURK